MSRLAGLIRGEAGRATATPATVATLAPTVAGVAPVAVANPEVDKIFIREYRRLSVRLSRILKPGYLAWTRENQPELYREIEVARMAWDTNERLESLKIGRIAWRDYRRMMLAWARLHVEAIRRHRACLEEVAEERAGILEFDAGG